MILQIKLRRHFQIAELAFDKRICDFFFITDHISFDIFTFCWGIPWFKLFFVLANQVNFLRLTQEGGDEKDVEVKADVVLLLHVVEEPGLVPVLEGNQASAEKAGDLLASHLDAARVSGQLIKLWSLLNQNVKTFSFLNSIIPRRFYHSASNPIPNFMGFGGSCLFQSIVGLVSLPYQKILDDLS